MSFHAFVLCSFTLVNCLAAFPGFSSVAKLHWKLFKMHAANNKNNK